MLFQIRDFKGCRKAEIPVSRIALLVGDGGASKTSVLQAIAAVTTGTTVPVPGINKTDAGRLLRSGAEKGDARWSGLDDKQAEYEGVAKWPKATFESQGATPFVSEFAAGLRHVLDLDLKKRAGVLTPLLKSSPARDDLLQALREAAIHKPDGGDLGDDTQTIQDMQSLRLDPKSPNDLGLYRLTQRIWAKIEEHGWDKAWSDAKERGIETKGQWKQVTGGQTYGSKLAESWIPTTGWSEDLEGTSVETLDSALAAARSALEDAVANQAVAADEVARLTALAGELPMRKTAADEAAAAVTKAESDLSAAEKHRKSLPEAEGADSDLACPHCDGRLRLINVGGYRLEKAAEANRVPDDELKKRRLDIASADGTIGRLRSAVNTARNVLAAAIASQREAEQAQVRAAGLTGADAATQAAQDARIDACRGEVRAADERLAAFRAWKEAHRLHRAICNNQVLIDLLAETGVRRRKLVKVLDTFNSSVLGPLCDAAGWKPVTLNEDLQAEYGGRSYPMLCKSEQHRARFVLQIAMAQLDGSALVLIDDADALPISARGGLLQMVAQSGLSAVIAMMVPSPDKAPNIGAGANPLGVTLWVEDGVTVPYADARDAFDKRSKKAA